MPPGALVARRGRRWHTLLGQHWRGGVDRPQQREPAGGGLRALLRRRQAVSADAPSEEGARRCLEARRGRGEHTAEGARRLSGKGWRSSSRLRRLGRMDGLDRWHWMMSFGSWPTTVSSVEKRCRSKAFAALHPQVMAQCLRHTLPERSGSSQWRNKIEELGPCEEKVEGGRQQTQHVCRDHQHP